MAWRSNLCTVIYECIEQGLLTGGCCSVILWVPLHADYEVTRAVFHRFDDAVWGTRNDDKIGCDIL